LFDTTLFGCAAVILAKMIIIQKVKDDEED
jgi:hypothetical protein